MMDHRQAEELESIQAIYCKPDEFTRCEAPDGQYVTIQFDFNLPHNKGVQKGGIYAFLSHDYPLSSPKELNVFCDNDIIPVQILHSFKLRTKERADTLKGEPMLLDLLCFVQESFENYVLDCKNGCEKLQRTSSSAISSSAKSMLCELGIKHEPGNADMCDVTGSPMSQRHQDLGSQSQRTNKNSDNTDNKNQLVTALLQLDHMRSKKSYVKLIQNWTSELGLNGRLLFYGRFIFIILQGETHQVKEYIIRNKTMIVDVDSKGRPCKERMLTVLCETLSDKHRLLKEFSVVENISSLDNFSTMLESFGMMDLFKEYIEPICCVKSKKSPLKK